ncbi:hypothetical protein LAZ67_1003100 [Cordylochernes scorpioides]|uniref:HTH CENPB-type domain-containing protein n=1 Tax=Cordylochernes scorpioides TaxID=51811 RepID=A0ABY6JY22_9ARAC|nr:hypothetical protein LAZ67_1003100 [Cordylochernes scorpioides]
MSGARMSGSAKKNWKRSQYHQLTYVEKMKIIEEIEQGKSHSQVSRERNIPRSTISTIFKNKFAIKSAFLKSNFSSTLKRDRDGEFPEIEEALFRWIRQANAMKLAINGNILKEKAILLALKMGQDNFEASNGWLEKFKARRNIAFKRLHGEAGSVDANSVATWKGGIIPSLLAKYSPQDIFNADETGLFYKLLPNQTMTIRGEKCEGGKKSKERITVLDDWGNFYGLAEKIGPNIQKKKRKFLLILDNCPAHQIPEGLQNIEIRFLPALTTSALQPCDMGIIKALKDQYRKRMITYLLTCMEKKKCSRFVMDEAMEEVVEEEMNRCFEALKKHQAIDVNYIDFLEVDKDVQVAGEQSIEEIVKEVMGKEDEETIVVKVCHVVLQAQQQDPALIEQLSKNITRQGLTNSTLNYLRLCVILEPMQELMSRHKAYALSPRDCLKTTLFQKWQRMVAPPGERTGLIRLVSQTDRRPVSSAETQRPPSKRRKRKGSTTNNTAGGGGKKKNMSPGPPNFSLASQDVMVVGEPSLMGGEFGDEDERLITRLENTQYDAAAAANGGLEDPGDDFPPAAPWPEARPQPSAPTPEDKKPSPALAQ